MTTAKTAYTVIPTVSFSGELRDIKANDLGTTNPVVTIGSTDVGFSSEDCGTWTRIG